MSAPDKRRVLQALLDKLAEDLSQIAQAAEETRKDATHAEAKPENDKDTRALEQSYLARGQAMRAEQLAEQREVLRFMALPKLSGHDAVCAGSLVELEDDDGATRLLFLAPHAGGTELAIDGTQVLVVTGASPLGAAIVGRGLGEEVLLTVRGRKRSYVISALQ